jgi:hypothetical protein
MKIRIAVLLVMQLFVCSFISAAEDVGKDIEVTVAKNFKAIEDGSLDAYMNTIHSQTPGYLSTKQATETVFQNYKLRQKVVYFKYIGQEGEFAIARVRYTTEKVSGGAFNNNEIDEIMVFKKENGEWKNWSAASLKMRYLPQ